MLKLSHCKRKGSVNENSKVFKTRVDMREDVGCQYSISLDNIQVDGDTNVGADAYANNVLITDVREHTVAGECLPVGVSGYWVRIFGPQKKYKFNVSLRKKLPIYNKDKYTPFESEMKIGEICINLANTGTTQTAKKHKRRKKATLSMTRTLINLHDLKGTDYVPTFCSKELYLQISTSLRECVEYAKFDLFDEMVAKFSNNLISNNRDSIELKQFLDCEKSQMLAVTGKFSEAKQLLQHTVESVIPKSHNKVFLLNRAYLNLSNVHLIEGNYGTAEECLNILQVDKKHGTPKEDISLLYFLRGVILLNFGKYLPILSQSLWAESKESFIKSLASFEHSSAHMFNHLCRVLIYEACLYICLLQPKDSQIHTNNEQLNVFKSKIGVVESYGEDRISTRNIFLVKLFKGELLFYENKFIEGHAILEELERQADNLGLLDIVLLCERFKKWWRHSEYNEFMNCIIGTSTKNVEFRNDVPTHDPYYGDVSAL